MTLARYEIVVEGHLGDPWAGWFEGIGIRYAAGEGDGPECTVLSLAASDPARLHGVLAQIGSLNLRLVAVRRLNENEPD
jgi:hypothetical protein